MAGMGCHHLCKDLKNIPNSSLMTLIWGGWTTSVLKPLSRLAGTHSARGFHFNHYNFRYALLEKNLFAQYYLGQLK